MMKKFTPKWGWHVIASIILIFTAPVYAQEQRDPAEITIGERLFLETRFAQAYAADPGKADPVMEVTATLNASLPGPFRGKTMNCRSCHLVDEHVDVRTAGMRSYADFSRHSPIPQRADDNTLTPRNSQSLVGIGRSRLLHFDGEFASMTDLVTATLTGRNYGWLATEQAQAVRHIANLIRNDDGKDEIALQSGGSYRRLLTGTDKIIPQPLRLPEQYRVDVNTADDAAILSGVAKLIAAYVDSLEFEHLSPYDRFLKINYLPATPHKGESDIEYSRRLRQALEKLTKPKFVAATDGRFKFHTQKFVFGSQELTGLKLFLAEPENKSQLKPVRSTGNCIACHPAPHFSDYNFHNTGTSQVSYDKLHGAGTFTKLDIPDLTKRNRDFSAYLPATARHPHASGRFRAIPARNKLGQTDLGVWNVFANPDIPGPQTVLRQLLCEDDACRDADVLPTTIARFKTPLLRDLGHSAPYMHSGQFTTLEQVLAHYVSVSALTRAGQVRNGDTQLMSIHINSRDIGILVAFLRSLNEDYE